MYSTQVIPGPTFQKILENQELIFKQLSELGALLKKVDTKMQGLDDAINSLHSMTKSTDSSSFVTSNLCDEECKYVVHFDKNNLSASEENNLKSNNFEKMNSLPQKIEAWMNSSIKRSEYNLELNETMKRELEIADEWDDQTLLSFANEKNNEECALVLSLGQVEFIGISDYCQDEKVIYVLPASKWFSKGRMAQSCCYKFFDLPNDIILKQNKPYSVVCPAVFRINEDRFVLQKKGKLV